MLKDPVDGSTIATWHGPEDGSSFMPKTFSSPPGATFASHSELITQNNI